MNAGNPAGSGNFLLDFCREEMAFIARQRKRLDENEAYIQSLIRALTKTK